MEIYQVWRGEIEAELVEARGELAVAKAELEAAQASAADARIERAALNAAIERIGKRMPVPGALSVRARHRDAELAAADAPVIRAKQAISAALAKIADAELALFVLTDLAPLEEQPETNVKVLELA